MKIVIALLVSKLVLSEFQPFGFPREVQDHLENFYGKKSVLDILIVSSDSLSEPVLQKNSINWVPSSWTQPLRVNDRRRKSKRENRSGYLPSCQGSQLPLAVPVALSGLL